MSEERVVNMWRRVLQVNVSEMDENKMKVFLCKA
jgi:hypothetical protein